MEFEIVVDNSEMSEDYPRYDQPSGELLSMEGSADTPQTGNLGSDDRGSDSCQALDNNALLDLNMNGGDLDDDGGVERQEGVESDGVEKREEDEGLDSCQALDNNALLDLNMNDDDPNNHVGVEGQERVESDGVEKREEDEGLDSCQALDNNALLDLNMNDDDPNNHVGVEGQERVDSDGVKKSEEEEDAIDTVGVQMDLNDESKTDQVTDIDYKTQDEEEQKDQITFGKQGVRCCDYALCRCLRRVPYATLFAFLLLAGGLALMTYEIIMIRETADDLFEGTVMYAEHSGYKKGLGMLLWMLITLVTIIAIFGLFFLVLACFSSGPSKKNTCGQRFVKCVNRVSISVVTIIAYLLCIAWIALSMALMLGLTFMLMVRSYCNSVQDNFTSETCVDLAQYGMVPSKPTTTTMSPTTAPSSNNTQTSICGEKLEDFCNMHDDIQLNVWLTITASIIVVISLIHFLMALAANHTYTRLFHKDLPGSPKYSNNFGSPGLAESPIY
ncbi:uncharacterized protein [Apostichopus japonicus]|uniref:uncharacterized protein isoform X2 n=1 Tax=Stichopus japonicus TaxID=307972 RepID=UPI003AB19B8B